jgi:hypothetical protein
MSARSSGCWANGLPQTSGISINSQKSYCHMRHARSPIHCYECERRHECYTLAKEEDDPTGGNVWCNLY